MVIDQGERGAMVIDREGKPMLWVKVADPPCILIRKRAHICAPSAEKFRGTWRCVWLLGQFWVRVVMEGIHQAKDIASCRCPAPWGSPRNRYANEWLSTTIGAQLISRFVFF